MLPFGIRVNATIRCNALSTRHENAQLFAANMLHIQENYPEFDLKYQNSFIIFYEYEAYLLRLIALMHFRVDKAQDFVIDMLHIFLMDGSSHVRT